MHSRALSRCWAGHGFRCSRGSLRWCCGWNQYEHTMIDESLNCFSKTLEHSVGQMALSRDLFDAPDEGLGVLGQVLGSLEGYLIDDSAVLGEVPEKNVEAANGRVDYPELRDLLFVEFGVDHVLVVREEVFVLSHHHLDLLVGTLELQATSSQGFSDQA